MKVKVTHSCLTFWEPMGYIYSPWNSPGQNTGVGSLSLLQVIFLTQGLNPGLPHFWLILYDQSHKGIPRILEWAAYSFSSWSFCQESNRSLLHCRRILYGPSYQESPVLYICCLNMQGRYYLHFKDSFLLSFSYT